MTDRYEEFKKYIQENGFSFIKQWSMERQHSFGRNIDTLDIECIYFDNEEFFKQFEEKYDGKQKEEEIKKIIMDIIDVEHGRVFYSNRVVDKIYDELKEKDLIK